MGLFCWYGSWSFVVLLWVAAGWNGWYSSAKRISCFVGILLFCASIAEIYLPSQIMRKWPAGGCCFAKGRTGVYWFENIFYSGGFSICAYCVGAIFFVYGFGFCFFLFVVGRVVCVRGRPVGVGVWKKAPGTCVSGARGGGYLLSRLRSTIGVIRFNFSVRYG